VKSNIPISTSLPLYYFEMEVLKLGTSDPDSNGVGLVSAEISTNNFMPGWEPDTYGYHGDDGMYYSDNQSKEYGPKFSKGEIIGCGYVSCWHCKIIYRLPTS
jgi:hypothetical protein